jgi:hypothetical protein
MRAVLTQGMRNLLRVYEQASAHEIKHGLTWYRDAQNETRKRLPQLSKSTSVGVVAALSPQTGWARNIDYAVRLVETGRAPSTHNRMNKARSILAGAKPLSILNGSSAHIGKEASFYRNIMAPEKDDHVTIDGHMLAAYMGERIYTSKVPSLSKNQYLFMEQEMLELAHMLGLRGHQLQAIIWLAWRRIHRVRRERPEAERKRVKKSR